MRGAGSFFFVTVCRVAAAAVLLAMDAGAAEFITTDGEFQVAQWKAGPNGLPANNILCLRQTRDGYLWIGTSAGLVRFDGRRFTPLAAIVRTNFNPRVCSALAEDATGALWAATSEGLLRVHERRAFLLMVEDGLPQHHVTSVCVLHDGSVWAGGEKGLALVREKVVKEVHSHTNGLRGDAVLALHPDAGGTQLIVVTAEGVQQFDAARGRFVDADPPRSPGNAPAVLLPGDRRGHFWAGTASGLDWFHDGQWTTFTTRDGLAANDTRLVFEDGGGRIWCHTRGGALHRFRGDHFERILPALAGDAVLRLDVNCLWEDREGSLWLGTADDGLVRLRPNRAWYAVRSENHIFDDVRSLCEGPDGTIHVATRNHLWQFRGNGRGEVDADRIRSIFADQDGVLWAGHFLDGLSRMKNRVWENVLISTNEPVQSSFVCCIFQARDRALWLSFADSSERKGVARFSGAEWRLFGRAEGLVEEVGVITQDREGAMWFGGLGGVTRLRNGQFETWTKQRGLSSDGVLSLYADADGAVWIGTDEGLNRFKDGRVSVLTTLQGLTHNTVNQIVEDDFGCLWLGSPRGLARFRRSDLNAVAEGRRKVAEPVSRGGAEGILSVETVFGQQPTCVKARDGRLWFATVEGALVVEPRAFEANAVPPPVVIERVLAEDEPVWGDGAAGGSRAVRPGGRLRFAAGRGRSLTFYFTANSLADAARARFRTKLEGHDRGWRPESGERFANYTNLKPGAYRFVVEAGNGDGAWTREPQTLAFVVEPRFTETAWFPALVVIAVAAVAWRLHRRRVQMEAGRERLERLHALEHERARIAQDMHDDLGASLTKIALMCEVARRDLADPRHTEANVERIAVTARTLVDSISEIVWAINPRNDTLDGLCAYLREFAAQLFEDSPVECRLDFPAELPTLAIPAALRRNLFLVVKESLNNILKHAGATRAEVRLRLREGEDGTRRLEVRVLDNGRGVDPARASQFSNGLHNMRQRMESLRGTFALRPGAGAGTEVVFGVPLPSAPSADAADTGTGI